MLRWVLSEPYKDASCPRQPEEEEEENWCNRELSWEGDALQVEPLAEEDFAGRYVIQYVGENGDMWRPQQDWAYVEITKRGTPPSTRYLIITLTHCGAGEGKYYVDRSMSGYFWLQGVDRSLHRVDVVWRHSRLSSDYALNKFRENAAAKGQTAEEIEAKVEVEEVNYREMFQEAFICYWDNVRSYPDSILALRSANPDLIPSTGQAQESGWAKRQASRVAAVLLV